jgi:hypothetical protein
MQPLPPFEPGGGGGGGGGGRGGGGGGGGGGVRDNQRVTEGGFMDTK